jgi:carbon-monoxide dehydrogenase medium subunit
MDVATDDLVIGAATTLAEVGSSHLVELRAPLLAHAARAAASAGIRSMATIGGNLLDAPAASDLTAAVMALGGTFVVGTPTGDRVVAATGPSAGGSPVAAGELLRALRVPAHERSGWGLQRLQTQGRADRPAATVALRLDVANGHAAALRAAATFVASRPIDLPDVAEAVVGASLDALAGPTLAETVEAAAAAAVDRATEAGAVLTDDTRASAGYRRAMVGVLVVRALADAARSIAR